MKTHIVNTHAHSERIGMIIYNYMITTSSVTSPLLEIWTGMYNQERLKNNYFMTPKSPVTEDVFICLFKNGSFLSYTIGHRLEGDFVYMTFSISSTFNRACAGWVCVSYFASLLNINNVFNFL